jgi:hypothetical protein
MIVNTLLSQYNFLKKIVEKTWILKPKKEVFKMTNMFKKFDGKKAGVFAAGVLFGTAGIKILSSKDAKNVYTKCTAAVLRAKECVMKTVTTIQENAEDIYVEAQLINEERQGNDTEFPDESEME